MPPSMPRSTWRRFIRKLRITCMAARSLRLVDETDRRFGRGRHHLRYRDSVPALAAPFGVVHGVLGIIAALRDTRA